ncbi:MAG: hypothetical protein ACREIP_06685 [Alphaproteobacteria bacterium]
MRDLIIQRMILRKEAADALSASETVKRIAKAGAVIVDENASSLLIEGDEATVRIATEAAAGWKAVSIQRYCVPDTRVKIDR